MLGEAERFRRFCAEPPGYTVCSGHMSLFRINGFGGYQFAFGEKVLIDGQVRIHLYLFRKYRHLFEFTAPMYQRFIRASQALNGETDTVLTPAAALIDDKAPSLFYSEESITDIQELTPEIVATLIERVEVRQAQVIDGVKKQEIKIIYILHALISLHGG